MFRPLLAVSALTSLSLSACADRAIARNELTRASTARSQPNPSQGLSGWSESRRAVHRGDGSSHIPAGRAPDHPRRG
jgi:outer membrane lipoprotein SlyB